MSDKKRQNRLTLLAIMIIFSSPMLLAYSSYLAGWFEDRSMVNQGQLLEKPYYLPVDESVAERFSKQLQIIAVPSESTDCDADCTWILEVIWRAHRALGKENPRVGMMFWAPSTVAPSIEIENLQMAYHTSVAARLQSLAAENTDRTLFENVSPGIYVADPIGNVMLHYPLPESRDQETIKTTGKAILKDLKRLLKHSKIG